MKIMIVGAGEEHRIGIHEAKSMNLETFVIDGNPEAPGFQDADDHAVVSTYDFREALRVAKEKGINGVMTLASDVPYTVAYVAEGLGLPGITLDAAHLLSDKMRMKRRMSENMVPMPKFRLAKNFMTDFHSISHYPQLVVKPCDSRGARGVQLFNRRFLTSQAIYDKAIEIAKRYSPTGRAMIEEYLPGPQLSVEGFMIDGEAHIPAIFDRNYDRLNEFAPYMVEDGGEMPSKYRGEYPSIKKIMGVAARSVGLMNGVVKGDLVIHEGVVKVIEIAGRLSGGWFATVATPYSTGINFIKNVIRWSLGEDLTADDWKPTQNRGAAIRFSFPNPGTVISGGLQAFTRGTYLPISPVPDPWRFDNCLYYRSFVKKGDVIKTITDHPGRPAVVVASGVDREDAVLNAKRLIDMIKIEVV